MSGINVDAENFWNTLRSLLSNVPTEQQAAAYETISNALRNLSVLTSGVGTVATSLAAGTSATLGGAAAVGFGPLSFDGLFTAPFFNRATLKDVFSTTSFGIAAAQAAISSVVGILLVVNRTTDENITSNPEFMDQMSRLLQTAATFFVAVGASAMLNSLATRAADEANNIRNTNSARP